MRAVLDVSFEDGYVTCKDSPDDWVALGDIELVMHIGIAGCNRKAIFVGDVVSFREGYEVGISTVMRTEKGE